MYEAVDFLHAHIAEVEVTVFFQTANRFNLSVDLIFYDTTTASFAIDFEDDADESSPGLRQYGQANARHPSRGSNNWVYKNIMSVNVNIKKTYWNTISLPIMISYVNQGDDRRQHTQHVSYTRFLCYCIG